MKYDSMNVFRSADHSFGSSLLRRSMKQASAPTEPHELLASKRRHDGIQRKLPLGLNEWI